MQELQNCDHINTAKNFCLKKNNKIVKIYNVISNITLSSSFAY